MYIAETERATAEFAYNAMATKAYAVLSAAFGRMKPAPQYPGGPVHCTACDTISWSSDQVEANARVVLLTAVKDVIDEALAGLPAAVKSHLDTNVPNWTECSDAIAAVADSLGSF